MELTPLHKTRAEQEMEKTDPRLLLESQGDVFADEVSSEEGEDRQRRAPAIRKVCFGMIAFLLALFAITAGVLPARVRLREGSPSNDPSDIELLANVVMPGVHISDLNETSAQYRSLEWLAYNDTRGLTIDDDATELLERFSVVTFYYSIGGESLDEVVDPCDVDKVLHDWSLWLKSTSHCDWDGFDCDGDGRVTTLDYYIAKMHGTLPTEIGNFKRLEKLLIMGNQQLVGTIPSEIGNMRQLSYLELSSNAFSGTLPTEIGNMQQLTTLRLTANKFSGPIPSEIGHLQELEDLDLPNNTFSGPIPSEIGKINQLIGLVLGSNNISGPISTEIGHLQQLDVLYLSNNDLSGIIPTEIGNLHKLLDLNLANNKLSGNIPSEIGNLEQLDWLTLPNNTFSGPIPSEIGNLQLLGSLNLSNNTFSGPIPSEIGKLDLLFGLHLSFNIGLTGTVPVEVGNMEELSYAYFEGTSLTGGLDGGFYVICNRPAGFDDFVLAADCGGSNPKITCECCTRCCRTDENGNRCDFV
eukprot:scaffold4004_cov105-Cylindrotheca_fusiformis.AAC.1